MTNPLVAQRQDSTQGFSGVPILESVDETRKAIESGDWAAGVLGAVGTGLDALGMALDPFGAILAAGVGWLMEHVGPVSDALDSLTGDPDEIKAHSQTWKNIGAELGAIAGDMAGLVDKDTAAWTGAAAEAYRARSADTGKLITAARSAAEGASSGIATAGEVVGAVRTLVRDIIAELVGHLVSWALQVVATLGIGLTWVVPQVVAEVAKVTAKIADITTKLVKAMQSLMPMLKKLGGSFDEAADALKKIKNNDSTAPPSAKTPPPPKQGLADRPARTSPTGAPPAGGKGPGTGPDTTTPAGADTPPPPKDVGAPRSGPGGGATPPPLFGAPRPPAPPTTRTGRPIVRPSAQNSTPQSAPPPRNVQPQAAPPQSAQPQSVPPHNAPPQKPQVIDASSFKTPDEANKFMQDHFGPVQQINKDKFDSKTPGHDTNCGNCTVATAHTIKTGQPYRVDPAKPMGLDDVANGSVPHGSSGKFQPFPGGYDQLSQDVANQPPGFVASVAARWPNEEVGHFFNVVKHPNGAVVYLDGQSGMPADISKKPSELYAMDYPNAPTNVSQTPAPQPNAPGATPNAPAVDTNVPAARPDTPPAQPQAPPASQQTPAPHHDLDVQMADADSPASRPGTPPAVDQDVPMSDAGGPSTSSDGDVPMEDAGSPRPSVDEDDLIE